MRPKKCSFHALNIVNYLSLHTLITGAPHTPTTTILPSSNNFFFSSLPCHRHHRRYCYHHPRRHWHRLRSSLLGGTGNRQNGIFLQKRIPDNQPFPCRTSGQRSRSVPTSVHQLRPGKYGSDEELFFRLLFFYIFPFLWQHISQKKKQKKIHWSCLPPRFFIVRTWIYCVICAECRLHRYTGTHAHKLTCSRMSTYVRWHEPEIFYAFINSNKFPPIFERCAFALRCVDNSSRLHCTPGRNRCDRCCSCCGKKRNELAVDSSMCAVSHSYYFLFHWGRAVIDPSTPIEFIISNLICLAFSSAHELFESLAANLTERTTSHCIRHASFTLIAASGNRRYWHYRSCWRFINKCDSCKFGRTMGSADWESWSVLVHRRSGELSYAFNITEYSQGIQSEIIWVSCSAVNMVYTIFRHFFDNPNVCRMSSRK